ncbi:MAG: hypothetical protein RL095_2486 [Verrucomicrobiota bacterium]|jgi:addiction module HigA family antidote
MKNQQMQEELLKVGRKLSHPGLILKNQYLVKMDLSAYRLAQDTGLSQVTVSDLIHGKRAITMETAIRLGRYFETSPQYWMNMQNHFEAKYYEYCLGDKFAGIQPCLAH